MFEKCIPMSKPKRGVVNTHQVIVLKFLRPEVCNSYFSYVTGGKFCIFSGKKNQDFQPHVYQYSPDFFSVDCGPLCQYD